MARFYYQGKYHPEHPEKYVGDVNKIEFRSMWERQLLRWCDHNPDVLKYSSEEIVIPYLSMVDNQEHRYFVDLLIEFKSGIKVLVELKPKHQTEIPKKGNKKNKTFIAEASEYARNLSKWRAADAYAQKHGLKFQVWTEETLRALGINI